MHRQFVEVADDKLIGSSTWRSPDGKRENRYMVLTVQDSKIADMQVCGTRRQALRFAQRNP